MEDLAEAKVIEILDFLLKDSTLNFTQLKEIEEKIKSYGAIKEQMGFGMGQAQAESRYEATYDRHKATVDEIADSLEANYWAIEGGRTRLKTLITGALREVESRAKPG
jgi:hypothetical protein